MRLGRPELSTEEIAQALGIDRKRLYAFFRRETSVQPGLTRMLYRQRQRAAAKLRSGRTSVLMSGADREAREGEARPPTTCQRVLPARQPSNPNNKESSSK